MAIGMTHEATRRRESTRAGIPGTDVVRASIRHIVAGAAGKLVLLEKYGLDVRSVENRLRHYHRTVTEWLRNLENRREQIRAIDPARFNEKFRRIWLYYRGTPRRLSPQRARSSIATISRSSRDTSRAAAERSFMLPAQRPA